MFDGNARAYIEANIKATASLASVVCSDEQSSVDAKLKLIGVITGLENEMLDFISSFSIFETDAFTVNSCLGRLIEINGGLIRYTEKLQLKGYKLDQVIHTLKLENRTIKEMML